MKQKQYSPLSVAEMAISLFTVDRGYLDDVDVNKVVDFESAMLSFMRSSKADLLDSINSNPEFNDEVEAAIKAAVEDFKANNAY
jgi:F-type H+-transporting ATPase subunit alpha